MPRTGERTSVRLTRSAAAVITSASAVASAWTALSSRCASARKLRQRSSMRRWASRSADSMRGTARRVGLELAGQIVDLALQAQAARSWRPPGLAASGCGDLELLARRARASGPAGRGGSGARPAPARAARPGSRRISSSDCRASWRARVERALVGRDVGAPRPGPRAANDDRGLLDLGAQPGERAEQGEVALAVLAQIARRAHVVDPQQHLALLDDRALAHLDRRRRCRPRGSAPPAPGWTGSPCRRRA